VVAGDPGEAAGGRGEVAASTIGAVGRDDMRRFKTRT
jgi:hypothetical protein